jgi:hypothetical protein
MHFNTITKGIVIMTYLDVRNYFSSDLKKSYFDHDSASKVVKDIFKSNHGVKKLVKVIKSATSAIKAGDAPKKVHYIADKAIHQLKGDKKKWFFNRKAKSKEVKDFDKIQKKYEKAVKEAARKSTN